MIDRGIELAAEVIGVVPASTEVIDQPILKANGLRKSFGGILAVNDVSFELKGGQVTALVGPNGAGKTTVFNLLAGAFRPDAGTVFYGDDDITGLSAEVIARKGIVRSHQSVRVFARMTALENVLVGVQGHVGERVGALAFRPFAVKKDERRALEEARACLDFVGLTDKGQQLAGSLSFGEQKLLALARVLATKAKVLLLDEPTSGIGREWVERTIALIRELNAATGLTICLVEHSLHVVDQLADTVFFLETGRITASGTVQELMSQPRLAKVYFGTQSK